MQLGVALDDAESVLAHYDHREREHLSSVEEVLPRLSVEGKEREVQQHEKDRKGEDRALEDPHPYRLVRFPGKDPGRS